MGNKNISRYVVALTELGLEDKFFSSEEFSGLPALNKINVVTDVINKELELGRWEKVVQTMYGDKKSIGQLYNGDENKLEKEIVKSSTQRSTYMKTEAIKTLKEAGKNDIIFKLAFNIPNLHYEEFMQIAQNAGYDFFQDTKKGEQRKQKLNQTAADLAMQEEKYSNAFNHFKIIGNKEKINNIFEIVLKNKVGYDDERLLQEIALSNEEQKESRLKKIVLKSASGEFNPLTAFVLYKEHNIQLSNLEKETFQKEIVKSTGRYDIMKLFPQHPEIQLLWAKKNAEDEPKTAYKIFTEQKYEGKEVTTAVKTGLNLSAFEHKERAMNVTEISEQHLKETYSLVPLHTKAEINSYLLAGAAITEPESTPDYLKEFKRLSRQANKENKVELAYDLWIKGGGGFNCKHINEVRTALIKERIKSHYGIIALNPFDRKGKIEAYNELMKTDHLRAAYKIALELGGKRLNQVHEKIVSSNPREAMNIFTENKDEKGLNYITKSIASAHNIGPKKLKTLINQYKTD